MLKRRKVGSTSVRSPIQRMFDWLTSFAIKLFFAAVATVAIYFFFKYLVLNFVNFLKLHISGGALLKFSDNYFLFVTILIIVVVDFYILKDNLKKR